MGRKSGITSGGYDPRIHRMHNVMEQREHIEWHMERLMSKKKMRANYWQQRFYNAVTVLSHADPSGWERWLDDDNHVPADTIYQRDALCIEQRVKDLTGSFPTVRACTRRGIFVWQDAFGYYIYSKEVGKDPLYMIEFDSMESAESFLQGLPFRHCGYGVVLDLLPAPMASPVETLQLHEENRGR